MAINVETEEILTLNQAARQIPGGAVSLCTMYRWRLKGVHGVKLECLRVGQEWRTSREAILRFIARLNPTTAAPPTPETPVVRSQRARSAMSELKEMGIGSGPASE